jgi:hypothetical protein
MIFVVVVGVYCCVWFCTHRTAEIGWFAVLFVCLELCICYDVNSLQCLSTIVFVYTQS